jgi:hypothetical protein
MGKVAHGQPKFLADFDLQLGFNARKYFATGYDVILMKCACVPGL